MKNLTLLYKGKKSFAVGLRERGRLYPWQGLGLVFSLGLRLGQSGV
jgi:hypothetical protein